MSKHALPLANFRNQSPTSLPATATGGFFWAGGLILVSMGLFIAFFTDQASTYPAADRRKTKPSGREARARLDDHDPPTPRVGRNARLEHRVTRLVASINFIQDFGHCSFPPAASPETPRSPRARQHLGQRVTADCPTRT